MKIALRIGLRLIITISATELIIMAVFGYVHPERWMSPAAIMLLDTSILAIITTLLTFYWVINPVKLLQEHVLIEDVLHKTDETLKDTSQRLQAIIQSSPLAILTLDTEGIVTMWNPAAEQIFGWKKEEVLGRPHPIVPEEKSEEFHQLHKRAMKGESLINMELLRRKKDGSPIHISLSTSPIFDVSGNVIGAMGLISDITERKKAEDALRKSEEKFRNLFESSTDGIFILDLKGNFIDINRTAYERLGYTKSEVLSINIKELDSPEYAVRLPERMSRIQEQGYAVFESAHRRKDGTIMPVEVNSRLIDYNGQKAYFSVIRDITERKKAEDVIKKSEERYRNLVENTPEVIYSLSVDGTLTSLNPAFEKITGWKVSEWMGKPFIPLIHPDDLSRAIDAFQRILQGVRISSYELRILSKSGEYLTGEFTSAPQIEDGRVVGEFGVVRDITERKKMEKRIYEISHDWEDTFNSITDMVTVHDKDWNIIQANKAAEKILGLPFLEKTPDAKCFRYYHGTEGPPPGCPSCDCLKTGIPATFELFEPHLNMFIEIRAIPRFDSNNNLIGLIHVVRDITERRKAEDERNKLLAEITKAKIEWEMTFDSTTELIILVDKELNIIRCNKSFADFVGKPLNEMLGHKCYDFLPCGEEQIKQCREKIGGEEATEWIEVETDKGQWLYVSHRPVYDKKGKFIHTVIIASDITYMKESQEKISKSEEELKKRVTDLEKFYEMSIGRELKMKELKKEIRILNEEIEKFKRTDVKA